MVIALDRARTADELALHRDVRDLMEDFARGGASPLTLTSRARGDVSRRRAAHRGRVVEMWQHDRRARELVLAATSDPQRRAVEAADPDRRLNAPLAASLRRDRPELVAAAGGERWAPTSVWSCHCAADAARWPCLPCRHPPRTRRRMALLDRAAEIGRQLSAILENAQLLDDVLRSRAELENVFNSLPIWWRSPITPVASSRPTGRLPTRVSQPRNALVDQRLSDLLSPALAEWIDAEKMATPCRRRRAPRGGRPAAWRARST